MEDFNDDIEDRSLKIVDFLVVGEERESTEDDNAA